MRVYLYRHGRTVCNDERRYQGRSDLPLSDAGARALSRAPFDVEAVYVSPLLRARQSAAILFPGVRQIAVPAFAEFDFGAFEGKSYLDMADDPAYRAWVESGCTSRCPGGESLSEFRERTCGAFAPLLEKAAGDGGSFALVAHSGTLRAILECYALPKRGYFDWEPPCGGGYALDYDGALWLARRRLRLSGTLSCGEGAAPC